MIKGLHIGCSGYHYDHWQGCFYPEDLPKKEWLQYYADHFDTVEFNNTFYQLPSNKKLDTWYQNTPKNYDIVLKGSRYVTHMKRLKDASEHVHNLIEPAKKLKDKLGCILWQLPPDMKVNMDRLAQFADALDDSVNHVVEFRHESWFKDEVYKLLDDKKIGVCMLSAPMENSGDIIKTSDTAYLRFHGLDHDNWYKYDYTDDQIGYWAEQLKKISANRGFVFFNNDFQAHAVKNAKRLKELMDKES